MADYERRPAGGHNSRKRRYRDDDDHHDRRQHQRRRVDTAPPSVRIRRQITGIADSPLRRWAEEVQSTANLVAEFYDDEIARRTFVDLVMQMIVEQPLKTPFVAAVVLIGNTIKSEIAEVVLARTTTALEEHVSKGEWRAVKLHLKFLACLQACLAGDGVFALLEALFSRAADLQTASSEDVIGTEIVKIILFTIPYIMASAPDQYHQKAAELMDKTDIIASEPHALQALIDPFHPSNTNGGEVVTGPSESICAMLQRQLQDEAKKGWPLVCLPKPWQMPLEEIEAQEKLSSAKKHTLPDVKIPDVVVAGLKPLIPEVYFSVYAEQDIDSVPPASNLASSLIRDGLTDSINVLDFNRVAAAKALIDVDCYFADGTFIKRATPFDELKNQPSNRSTWKPEDVAVDTVFSQLYQLPKSEHKSVYYHALLTEACKQAPAAVAPSLGRAIRYLYRNNPRMDLELSFRFVDWFAHHLSNFGFTWKWVEWQDDASLSQIDPKLWFLKGALDKEVRLSFAQRIQKTLPEPYLYLVGPEKEKDTPDFKFKDPTTPFSKEGQEIAQLIRQKSADEEFQPVLDAIRTQATEQALDPLVAIVDVYTTAICWVGSKSLSHVLACIDRAKGRLEGLASSSEEARIQVLASVSNYWAAHPGIALSIIEKLLNYSIITPISVASWALSADSTVNGAQGGRALGQPHVFEAVSNTVTKVTTHTRQVVTSAEADNETKEKDIRAMRDLFRVINDSLTSWASGSKDEQMEQGDGTSDEEAMIQRWGQRWLRVFNRAAALEETFILEASKNQSNGDAMDRE